jgi:hypothetical protein
VWARDRKDLGAGSILAVGAGLAAELASGQITYGEHNRRAVQLAVDADSTSNKMAAEQRLIEAAAGHRRQHAGGDEHRDRDTQ